MKNKAERKSSRLKVTPDAPDDIKRTVSLVEVHPSESMRLNVLSHTSSNTCVAMAGSTMASVVTTESIVAKEGASIPAPFAIPTNFAPPTEVSAIFGLESVVMIASAASRRLSTFNF